MGDKQRLSHPHRLQETHQRFRSGLIATLCRFIKNQQPAVRHESAEQGAAQGDAEDVQRRARQAFDALAIDTEPVRLFGDNGGLAAHLAEHDADRGQYGVPDF